MRSLMCLPRLKYNLNYMLILSCLLLFLKTEKYMLILGDEHAPTQMVAILRPQLYNNLHLIHP